MLNNLLKDIDKIYIAYGSTDFRKQINSLCTYVKNMFNIDPYQKVAFIFCNKKRNSIKVLVYDKNGFILAQKTLLEINKMKFQWPKSSLEIKNITKEQLQWLLSGLSIYPKKYFEEVKIEDKKVAF